MALCSKIKPPSKEVVRNYPIKLVEVECLYKSQINPIRLWSLKLFVPLIIIVCVIQRDPLVHWNWRLAGKAKASLGPNLARLLEIVASWGTFTQSRMLSAGKNTNTHQFLQPVL